MLTVAVDTGPLYGPMTGVGRAVSGVMEEFEKRSSDIDIVPYVVSRRARLEPGTRRLPYPAAFAMVAWSHWDHPRPERHLAPSNVLHGMNYVVPPVRCPRVVSVYDTWALRHPESCSSAVNRAMRILRRNVDSGAVVHTTSHATADHVRELFPRASVRVIYLGSPRIVEQPNPIPSARPGHLDALVGSSAPYVLAVGTIERRKNLPRLVEAFSHTDAARAGVRLVLAGAHGNDSDVVRSVIDAMDADLGRNVVLAGRVGEDELDSLYRHADVVAYPSLDEGFGFPILEAMSKGVPVVASNRGSIPEIAHGAAVLVDPLDVESLVFALDRAISDESLRRHLRDAGIERCSQFTWSGAADDLIGLYRDISAHGDPSKGP